MLTMKPKRKNKIANKRGKVNKNRTRNTYVSQNHNIYLQRELLKCNFREKFIIFKFFITSRAAKNENFHKFSLRLIETERIFFEWRRCIHFYRVSIPKSFRSIVNSKKGVKTAYSNYVDLRRQIHNVAILNKIVTCICKLLYVCLISFFETLSARVFFSSLADFISFIVVVISTHLQVSTFFLHFSLWFLFSYKFIA